MNSKLYIVFSLFLLFAANAYACLMATQERIIPIGTSDNCLIGLEVLSNRYGMGKYREKAVWDFQFTIKGFNSDDSEYQIDTLILEKGIANEQVEELLRAKLHEALQICHQLDDFLLLQPKTISFCDFQTECSKIDLFETDQEMRFKLKNEDTSYPIHFLNTAYQGEIAKPYKKYFDFYFEDATVGIDLKISSVREYENSSYKLTIFHLGTGQEIGLPEIDEDDQKQEYKFDKPLSTIQDAVFTEPILHHGKGFDYFRLSKK